MYKAGDKFVIEIGETYETTAKFLSQVGEKSFNTPNNLYRIKGFNSLVFDENGLDKLEKYEDREESDYQRGLNDAWKAADKLNRMTIDEVREVFSSDPLSNTIERECIFSCCIPNLAIEKIKSYEEQKKAESEEIKVGDEVYILNRNYPYIVTYINNNGYISFFSECGKWGNEHKSKLTKTGRHFDQIAEVLKQMKEGEE